MKGIIIALTVALVAACGGYTPPKVASPESYCGQQGISYYVGTPLGIYQDAGLNALGYTGFCSNGTVDTPSGYIAIALDRFDTYGVENSVNAQKSCRVIETVHGKHDCQIIIAYHST